MDIMRHTLKRAMSAARYDDEDEQNTPLPTSLSATSSN
jgi:hypothetical protein